MKKTIGCLLLSLVMFSGQASAGFFDDLFDVSAKRLKRYESVMDKQMVDAFYTLSPDGKTESLVEDIAKEKFSLSSMGASMISVQKTMFTESNMNYLINDMNSYSYDSSSDILVQKYVAVAKARGNIVKLYKPQMGKIINSLFAVPFEHMQQTAEWYGLDNALIEYDQNGSPVSFMARAHQARTTLGVDDYQYTSIYFGKKNCRYLENNTKNSDFQEYVIREL